MGGQLGAKSSRIPSVTCPRFTFDATITATLSLLTQFSEAWIPLLAAVSPFTIIPFFLRMSEGMDLSQSRKLARGASVAGFSIAVALILVGQRAFRFLGITVDDLRVAGGIILLLLSIHDLIFTREKRKADAVGEESGVVPLGIPIIVGPAALTTSLVLADSHGRMVVLAALTSQLFLVLSLIHI